MGRKKVDKDSIEYLVTRLFYGDNIIGFQFTAGNTPLGIIEKRPLQMSCSINRSSRSLAVIDSVEYALAKKIEEAIFGKDSEISMKTLKSYKEQFKDLGYEVEEGTFVGEWYWFRVHCKCEEIMFHVNRIKHNLVL